MARSDAEPPRKGRPQRRGLSLTFPFGSLVVLSLVVARPAVGAATARSGGPFGGSPGLLGGSSLPRPSVAPPKLQLLASPAFLNLGNTTTLTALVTGGKIPLAYQWSSLPPGCPGTTNASVSCFPTSTGTYTVGVSVTDALGRSASNTTSLTVNASSAPVLPNPPHVLVLASPSELSVGNSTTVVALVTGGKPWFRFSWSLLPVGCTAGNVSSFLCQPAEPGTYTPTVTLTDVTGSTATNGTGLVVNSSTTGGSSGGSSGGGLSFASAYVLAGLVGVAAAIVTAVVIVAFLRRPPRARRPPASVPPGQALYVPPTADEPSEPSP